MNTLSRKAVLVLLLVMSASGGEVFAQAADTPPPKPEKSSLPTPQEVLNLVDKATSPEKADEAGKPAKPGDWSAPVKLAVVFAILAILPSLLVMMTSFTRIIIVLSFLRRALTTQNIPPTIAIIGLALFLTLFTMAPTFTQINAQAVQPYMHDQMNFADMCAKANNLLKVFMFRQTRDADLELFMEMAGTVQPESVEDIPSHIMIPSFAISEFRKAFEMGCLIFIPFLLVDLVTSGILLSAGMMMLPPAMISLPFKIILFVLVDGWRLITNTLISSFH